VNFVSQAGTLLDKESHNIALGGTLRVATPEADRFGTAVTKWAIVGAQFPVAVNLFFEYVENPTTNVIANTVGFNDGLPMKDFSLPVEFEPQPPGWAGPRTVGVALANTTGASSVVTLKLVDSEGAVLAAHFVTLPPFGQTGIALG
jgi:hypothetical protein